MDTKKGQANIRIDSKKWATFLSIVGNGTETITRFVDAVILTRTNGGQGLRCYRKETAYKMEMLLERIQENYNNAEEINKSVAEMRSILVEENATNEVLITMGK